MKTDMRAIIECGRMKDHNGNRYVRHLTEVGIRHVGTPNTAPPDVLISWRDLKYHPVDLEIEPGWYADGKRVHDIVGWVLETDAIYEWFSDQEIIDDIRWSQSPIQVEGVTFHYDTLIEQLLGDGELQRVVGEWRADYVRHWSVNEILDFADGYGYNLKHIEMPEWERVNNAHKAVVRGTWPC